MNYFKSHLENVTKAQKTATSVKNDLKQVQEEQKAKQKDENKQQSERKEEASKKKGEQVSTTTEETTIENSKNPFETLILNHEETINSDGSKIDMNGVDSTTSDNDESINSIRRRLQQFTSSD